MQQDKLLHFCAGLVLGFIWFPLAVIAGIGKEALDWKRYDGWDNIDLLATIVGGLVGYFLRHTLF